MQQLAGADSSSLEHSTSTTRGRPRGPQGPRIRSTPSTTLLHSNDSTLLEDGEVHSPVTVTPPSSPSKTLFGSSHESDVRPPTPTPVPTPPPPEVLSSMKVPAPKSGLLTLPPKINFESTPVAYKGLPLDAAQWTFSSHELQQIVSRAIRLSSNESFIRLLSLEHIDRSIPEELERLDNLRAVTQAKYRFHTHRRSMLLQGLNAIAMSASGKSHSADTAEVVGRLTTQLSENTADSDRLAEELLRISDQQTQLARVQDCHWASALAVALRKLHKSYAKRTKDLQAAKEHITRLEGELEDAWLEAEKMAKEMDEFDTDIIGSDYEDEVDVEMAEIVAVHRKLRVQSAEPNLVSDASTIRTIPSASNRTERVSAAKKRSSRASGLRLPRKATASRPSSGADQDMPSPVIAPPVPKLVETLLGSPQLNDQSLSSSFLNISPTTSETRPLPGQAGNNSEPDAEAVPYSVEDSTDGTIVISPSPDALKEPEISPQSSEFDDSAIPSIWLQSDMLQPKARIRSLMALGTSRVDAERTRPSSSVLSRVPSFDSARAVSYDSDGIISYESGRIASLDYAGASLPALQPNRSASYEYVRDVPPSRSKTTKMSSSSSDKVLSPYNKLKMLTKRYTLPFHRGGGKRRISDLP